MKRSRWYKDAIIYQIYPRSFRDSNGDGTGDIRGIIEKLDYLKSLGINAVWLSPCYKSPNDDNGYDISDYRDIMDEFGTLKDWEEMIKGMHERGIKLIMDLVVNHTSDEHPWFVESRKSVDNPYRDYYIWRKGKGKDGRKPPNNWTSRFGGSAWEYDDTTGEWYLHLFTKKQPDLNWDNPKVRKEVQDICKYWLDKGVDGFRCDVITYISKAEGLPDGKWNPAIRGDEHFSPGPNIHKYLNELNLKVLSNYDCMTVGETPNVTVDQGLLYVSEERNELDTVFIFEHIECNQFMRLIPRKFNLVKFKKVIFKWQYGLKGKGWNSLYLENHDQPRSIPTFVSDLRYRKQGAKMLAIAMHMLEGTPYVYQGQEIGMTNCKFELDEYRDVMVKTVMGMLKYLPFLKGFALKVLDKRARDHARTPMQWDSSANAGFTEADATWIKVNPNYTEINVEEAEKDPDSILNFYRKLIAYRKGNEIIKNGTLKVHFINDKNLMCYERWWRGDRLFVLCNFKPDNVDFKLPNDMVYKSAKLALHNYGNDIKLEDMTLRPYEAMVFELK
ncbi:MAG: alpha-glucosidase [Christensenellales bacterium]|jgi:oligo-1,6-glucosidase